MPFWILKTSTTYLHTFVFLLADNIEEQLRSECTLSDYRLTEIAICAVNSRGMSSSSNASISSRSVSTSDILRLQQHNPSHSHIGNNASFIDNTGHERRVGNNTRLVSFEKLNESFINVIIEDEGKKKLSF